MPIRKRFSRSEPIPSRHFYAFVENSIDPPAPRESPRTRISLHLDAIEVDALDGSPSQKADEYLALIRILTTRGRLARFNMEAPEEGAWLRLAVRKTAQNPRAWIFPSLAVGFGEPLPAINAIEITRIVNAAQVQRMRDYCSAPEAGRIKASELVGKLGLHLRKNLAITALDVGQAACVAFTESNKRFGFFDVGKPLYFNRRSWPHDLQPECTEGFVLLSHWDFDHYAWALNNPSLMALDWYAPEQAVGFSAARFQRRLGARLKFITGDAHSHGVLLQQCKGSAGDRNATGYVLRFARGDETVLLTGDADYQWIPGPVKHGATSLMIPHHGGKGTLPPLAGTGKKSVAVASYGNPNTYKHPDEAQLKVHGNRGWRVKRTAAHGMPTKPRGPEKLYPLVHGAPAAAATQQRILARV